MTGEHDLDAVERALRAGLQGQPSPRFTRRVMAAVHREARMPPPLPFPWRRFVIGLGIMALWLLVGSLVARSAAPIDLPAITQRPLLLAGVGFALGLLALGLTRPRLRA